MLWQPPHAEMHFTLFILQEYLLVVESPEQLQEIHHSKFAGTMSSKVIIEFKWSSKLCLDILFKSTCSCIYALRECCIAVPFLGGRLAGWRTPAFACLLYLHKSCIDNERCCMDNDVVDMSYMNWKINIPALWISSMEVVS